VDLFRKSKELTEQSVPNEVLREFIKKFKDQTDDKLKYFDTMHDVINQSMEYIEPMLFADHPQYALFANKPVAIIRCSVDLKSSKALSYNQSPTSIRKEINDKKGVTQDYENILFPAQIGNTKMFDDGVIGYWKSSLEQPFEGTFYATVASTAGTNNPHAQVKMKTSTSELDWNDFPMLSLAGQQQYLTLLKDPRAPMTVTTHVLPAITHPLPSIYFKKSLDNLQVTFDASVTITPKKKTHIPIMRDPSIKWKWWNMKDENQSISLNQKMVITKDVFTNGLNTFISDPKEMNPEADDPITSLWNLLIQNNESGKPERQCLFKDETNPEKYLVDTAKLNLKDTTYDVYQNIVRLVLENESEGILPPIHHTHLGIQEIKDGWLQLDNFK